MNRLLRKYNRILLAVFGVGLMIVFLMPQLPDLMAQFGGRGSEIATMGEDGKAVTREDWQLVQQQVQILQRLEGWLPPLPIIGSIGNDPDRYYLLIHEASQAGLIGGVASAPINPDDVLIQSRKIGFPPAAVRQTLINYTGIRRYLGRIQTAGRLSDRRLKLESRRMLDGVDARYVVVPAKAESGKMPDEATQLAHFDQWGDVEPGEGEHGFGYRLPDRAAVEWLEIPRPAVEASVRAAVKTDDLEARKFWRKNQARFETVDGATAVPDEVLDAYVEQRVSDLMPTIARGASDALRAPRRGFATHENFVVLPDTWKNDRLSMDTLRVQLAERFDLALEGDGALPAAESTDGLADMESLSQLPGVGAAGTNRYGPARSGNPTRRLSGLVALAREFGGTGEVPVQNDLAGPVLTDRQGNLWIFRMTAADSARPPASLDEVRPEVTGDLQRLSHWNELLQEQDAMKQLARASGLKGVAEARGETVQGPSSFRRYMSPNVARDPVVRGLGADQTLIDGMVDRSIELGTNPLSEIDRGERVLVLPSDQNMAILVAELDRRVPMRQPQFDSYFDQGLLTGRIMADELGGPTLSSLAESFTADALRERNAFVRSGQRDDEDADDEQATTASAR
ncbi:MAG: hypothetical protein QF471_06350 [Phycisphaerales bacterium]|nr:hypothetical protein [Phycisphaerales bacterium]